MAGLKSSPIGRYLPRRVTGIVSEALDDTRVVLVNGARQSGKSTLVQRLAKERGAAVFTFDDPNVRRLAELNPTDFVRQADRMVIDEVQRYPDILLSIKELVDREFVPGRFLLTGSARVLGLRDLPDTLVGRMETTTLWPLSQGEIDGAPDGFIDAAFSLGADLHHTSELTRNDYIDRVVRGGFPEAIGRAPRRRTAFFNSYVSDLINRDVIQLSEIEHGRQMRDLIRLLASRSGQLMVAGTLASEIGVSLPTAQRYIRLLEEVYLVRRIPAFSRNLSSRVTRTPKVVMADSGVAASLLAQNEASLRRLDSPLGGLLEGFVAMELVRQVTWSDDPWTEISHYRTKDKIEVDLVLENRRRQVIGIEVKGSSNVDPGDFRGLRHLRDRLGDDFLAGYVLYTGQETYAADTKLKAMPIGALWETPTS